MGPKRIEEILGQELELSPEVNAKIEETYQLLRKSVTENEIEKSMIDGRKKEEITDKEKAVRNEVHKTVISKFEKTTEIGEIAGYRKKRYSKLWVILAASLLLGAGASVYAAVRYFTEADLLGDMAGENFGIMDFWKKRGYESETESEVLQISDLSGEKMENQYAVYNILEAFYDGEVVNVIAEVTPKEGYLIVPQDCEEKDLVCSLLPDELPEEMSDLTLAEYADANGNELVFTGVSVFADSCSVDFLMTGGGGGYFCMTAPLTEEEETLALSAHSDDAFQRKIFLKLVGTANKAEDKEVSRCETEVMVFYGKDVKTSVYTPENQEEISEHGIMLQKVELKETNFGIYAAIYYDLDSALIPNGLIDGLMIDLNADESEMQNLPYYAGAGVTETENGFMRINAYQKIEGTKEYFVIARNYVTGEIYGSVRLLKE